MSASTRPLRVDNEAPAPGSAFRRRRPLPALALPKGREDRRAGAVLSVLLHVLLVGLLATPFAIHHAIVEQEQGAGGPGPAGGGGGGHGGTGGQTAQVTERVQFIRVAAVAPTPAPVPEQAVVPPPVLPPPEPVKVEPVPIPSIEPTIATPVAAKIPDVAATAGIGGGSGRDGTNGSGPGSGGGVGSGIGTGRGSGIGPGTGGGGQENYPPQPIEFFLPPLPAPDKVRGFHLIAEFDVDSTGRVLSFDFTRTKDGDYNKRLAEVLRNMRFRPGTRPDGTPIRMKAQIGYEF